jgi:hypothetical protein
VDVIHELLATRIAAEKLGARAISIDEAQQLIDNRYVIVRNTGRREERERARRLMIGRTDGGHAVTLVVERTSDPTTWVIVTGWSATDVSVRFSIAEMPKDPWTDSDPEPGDFDQDLAAIDPRDVQVVEAGSGGRVTLIVSVEGEDAKRLERIAAERGKGADEVVADLVRNA